jgi:hypothetical protein
MYRELDQNNNQNGKSQDTPRMQTMIRHENKVQFKPADVEGDRAVSEDEDSEQKVRSLQLMCQTQEEDLLQAMELLDADNVIIDQDENSAVLDKEVMTAIEVARELDPQLKAFEKKKRKTKPDAWGAVLVDRERRKQNDGKSKLQKAMDLIFF